MSSLCLGGGGGSKILNERQPEIGTCLFQLDDPKKKAKENSFRITIAVVNHYRGSESL